MTGVSLVLKKKCVKKVLTRRKWYAFAFFLHLVLRYDIYFDYDFLCKVCHVYFAVVYY